MPNTKEIEMWRLVNKAFQNSIEKFGDIFAKDVTRDLLAKDVTRDLLANGVTVQEWISVKDRLPEDESNVLGCLKIGEEYRIFPAHYAKGVWWDCLFSTPANVTTHWMPLPQPPKGE